MLDTLPVPPTPRLSTLEEDRVRHGLLRHVREAVAANRPLPGELELAATLHASRQQIRHTLAELDARGIVRRRQGAATTVDPVGLRLSVRLEEQFEHTELLSRLGYVAGVEVIERGLTSVTSHIAALLKADPGAPAATVLKRWTADGVPAMVAEDTLLLPPGVTDVPVDSVFTAVAEMWGESIVWEVATPGVVALDARMAALLDLDEGVPVMTFETVGVSASGRRLFRSLEHHHPGVVSYSVVRTVRPPWRTE